VPPSRIVEAVDVSEDGQLCICASVPWPPPDHLCLDRLEKGLDSGVVVAVALAAHRYPEFVPAQRLLVFMRTVLRGFERSSQRFQIGGCDDKRHTRFGAQYETQMIVTRATACSVALWASHVLAADQTRHFQ